LYYTASGTTALKQVSGLKLLKYNSLNMSTATQYHPHYFNIYMNEITVKLKQIYKNGTTIL